MWTKPMFKLKNIFPIIQDAEMSLRIYAWRTYKTLQQIYASHNSRCSLWHIWYIFIRTLSLYRKCNYRSTDGYAALNLIVSSLVTDYIMSTGNIPSEILLVFPKKRPRAPFWVPRYFSQCDKSLGSHISYTVFYYIMFLTNGYLHRWEY